MLIKRSKKQLVAEVRDCHKEIKALLFTLDEITLPIFLEQFHRDAEEYLQHRRAVRLATPLEIKWHGLADEAALGLQWMVIIERVPAGLAKKFGAIDGETVARYFTGRMFWKTTKDTFALLKPNIVKTVLIADYSKPATSNSSVPLG